MAKEFNSTYITGKYVITYSFENDSFLIESKVYTAYLSTIRLSSFGICVRQELIRNIFNENRLDYILDHIHKYELKYISDVKRRDIIKHEYKGINETP